MSLLSADRDLTRNSVLRRHGAARAGASRRCRAARDCDVAIVGGGLAGLSAAIELAERGFAVVLLEARAGRLGRQRAQRRAGASTAWPATSR